MNAWEETLAIRCWEMVGEYAESLQINKMMAPVGMEVSYGGAASPDRPTRYGISIQAVTNFVRFCETVETSFPITTM